MLKPENQTAMTTTTRNGTGLAVQIIHPTVRHIKLAVVKQNVICLIWPT